MISRLTMLAATAVAGLMLGGCVIVDADVRESEWDRAGRSERLYGAEVGVRSPDVTITAYSGGCTRKEHFAPHVDKRGEDRFDLRFRRVTDDHCKALVPDGVKLTWSFAELGLPPGAQVTVVNRIGR